MTKDAYAKLRRLLVNSALEAAYRNAKAAEIMELALHKIAAVRRHPGNYVHSEALGMILVAEAALKRAEKIRTGE